MNPIAHTQDYNYPSSWLELNAFQERSIASIIISHHKYSSVQIFLSLFSTFRLTDAETGLLTNKPSNPQKFEKEEKLLKAMGRKKVIPTHTTRFNREREREKDVGVHSPKTANLGYNTNSHIIGSIGVRQWDHVKIARAVTGDLGSGFFYRSFFYFFL